MKPEISNSESCNPLNAEPPVHVAPDVSVMSRRVALSMIATSPLLAIPAAQVHAASLDAKLIQLGELFSKLYREYCRLCDLVPANGGYRCAEDLEAGRAYDAYRDVIDEANLIRAYTLQGMAAKARMIARSDDSGFEHFGESSIDDETVLSLVRDLLRHEANSSPAATEKKPDAKLLSIARRVSEIEARVDSLFDAKEELERDFRKRTADFPEVPRDTAAIAALEVESKTLLDERDHLIDMAIGLVATTNEGLRAKAAIAAGDKGQTLDYFEGNLHTEILASIARDLLGVPPEESEPAAALPNASAAVIAA